MSSKEEKITKHKKIHSHKEKDHKKEVQDKIVSKNKDKKLKEKNYEKELEKLQIELLKLQYYVKEKGLKVLILMEGRDAAGKGGTIKRLTEHLNPRGCRVVALPAPSDREKTQWYFQRYVEHLPAAGEIVIFDRSWYNRAMVEPVMGFCTDNEYRRFLRDVPFFELLLSRSDMIIFKFFLSVKKSTQKKRFKERTTNPLKTYKLSDVDKASLKLWDKYTVAQYNMFMSTDSELVPWIIVDSNNKKNARLNTFKYILKKIDYKDKIDEKHLTWHTADLRTADVEIKLMEETTKIIATVTNERKSARKYLNQEKKSKKSYEDKELESQKSLEVQKEESEAQ